MGRTIRSSALGCWLGVSVVLNLAGCALLPSYADRTFAERDFAAARDAYLDVLERHDAGRRAENALYHLGLIYLQPGSDLFDPEAARSVLTRLTHIRPSSELAAKASMLLALQSETQQLGGLVAEQQDRARRAQAELTSARREVSETEAQSQNTARKVGQLGSRIGRLESQIAKLKEELSATEVELAEREEELARLKSIDLGQPPP